MYMCLYLHKDKMLEQEKLAMDFLALISLHVPPSLKPATLDLQCVT